VSLKYKKSWLEGPSFKNSDFLTCVSWLYKKFCQKVLASDRGESGREYLPATENRVLGGTRDARNLGHKWIRSTSRVHDRKIL